MEQSKSEPAVELMIKLCDMTAAGIIKTAQSLTDEDLQAFDLSHKEIEQCAHTLKKIVHMGKSAQQ